MMNHLMVKAWLVSASKGANRMVPKMGKPQDNI